MAACVETMFSVRETPWHGLGEIVKEALSSEEAIKIAGLDWDVVNVPVYAENNVLIPGYKANKRNSDGKILGIVSDRYQVIQNSEAFAFTDSLLGDGVRYETAGSLSSGRRIWMLAKMKTANITGEAFEPYLVFTNSHDGTSAVRVAMTTVRVVCQNTLNLALRGAQRQWSCVHKGDIAGKLHEAEQTLFNANEYMDHFVTEIEDLKLARIPKDDVVELINNIIPIKENEKSNLKIRRLKDQRDELLYRYEEAPDLQGVEHSMYRFINAVSDFATHRTPDRLTTNYQENMFMKTIDGNKVIDLAYRLARQKMTAA